MSLYVESFDSSYELPAIPQTTKRTAATILAWVVDGLDGVRRPRRPAALVLKDTLAKLHRLETLERKLAVPSPSSGETSGVGVVEALPAADSTLRTSSDIGAPIPMEGTPSDLADLRRLEAIGWQQIHTLTRQGKTYGLAQLMDQVRRIKVDQLKFKEKETASMVPKVEVEEMMRRVKDALQPHPEALRAVMEALGG